LPPCFLSGSTRVVTQRVPDRSEPEVCDRHGTRSCDQAIQQIDGLFLPADDGIHLGERFRHFRTLERIDAFRQQFGGAFRCRNRRVFFAETGKKLAELSPHD
jgi:hypothetical protein